MNFKSVQPRRLLSAVALGVALAGGIFGSAYAYDESSTSAVNVDKQSVSLRGHDPVAYFSGGAPTKGDKKFSATWQGATYHFASEKNRDTFKADPAKFAPQYGGFCAMGVALGKKLDGDPEVWKVVDGKLYLNVNRDVSVKWNEDIPGNLKKAEANWSSIKGKAPSAL